MLEHAGSQSLVLLNWSRTIASRLLAVLAAVFLSASVGCSSDREALATYDSGTITRADFRQLFTSLYRDQAAEVAKNIDTQFEVLENEAILRLAALEAEAIGLDKLPEYRNRTGTLPEQTQLQAFYESLLASAAAEKTVEMVEVQFLFLAKASDKQVHAWQETLNDPAKTPAEIDTLIKKNTEAKKHQATAGYLPPQCAACPNSYSAFLTEPLRDQALGKFIHFKRSDGHWFVRKLNQRAVDKDNLTDYFRSFFENQASTIKAYMTEVNDPSLKNFYQENFPLEAESIQVLTAANTEKIINLSAESRFPNRIEKIKKQKDFILHKWGDHLEYKPGNQVLYKDTTPLYTLAGTTYTYGELKKRLPSDIFTLKDQLLHLHFLIMHALLQADPEYVAMQNSPAHRFIMDSRRHQELKDMYYDHKMPAAAVVTEVRIKAEYERRRDNQFKGVPLKSVRQEIIEYVQSVARHEARMRIKDELFKKYHLVLARTALRPGKL